MASRFATTLLALLFSTALWASGGDGSIRLILDSADRPAIEAVAEMDPEAIAREAGEVGAPTADPLQIFALYEAIISELRQRDPNETLFFIGRDGEALYDAFRMTAPEEASRAKLIPISRLLVSNSSDAAIVTHLQRHGMDLAGLESGRSRAAWIDTGTRGTIYIKLLQVLVDRIPNSDPDKKSKALNLLSGIHPLLINASGTPTRTRFLEEIRSDRVSVGEISAGISNLYFDEIPSRDRARFGIPGDDSGAYRWVVDHIEHTPKWGPRIQSVAPDGTPTWESGGKDASTINRRKHLLLQARIAAYFGGKPAEAFEPIREAQDTGRYAALLQDKAFAAKTGNVRRALVAELEALKEASSEERSRQFNSFLRYWSEANKEFQEGAPGLHVKAGITEDEIRAGAYDSAQVADRLLKAIRDYDRDVVIPLIDQIEQELVRDFSGSNILFLGRDFTPAYVRISAHGQLPHLHLANISRKIRDEALDGRLEQLRTLLAQVGLDERTVLSRDLVILDSSMGGKIPAAILRALMEKLDDSERFRLLTHTRVRYVKSSKTTGTDLEALARAAFPTGKAPLAQAEQLLASTYVGRVPEFALKLPDSVTAWSDRKHKLLEWRPKAPASAVSMETRGGLLRLVSQEPSTPSERVNFLLGLEADRNLWKASRSEEPPLFRELDAVAKNGREALTAWQKNLTPETSALFGQLQVREIRGGAQELWFKGKLVYRLVRLVGEGNNVRVYLTEAGTVVKVVKLAEDAPKQLLQAWMERWMVRYGMRPARVLAYEPHGLYLEQEHMASESLEYLYGHSSDPVPPALEAQVLADWERAKKLAQDLDIYLDLKAANCHLDSAGRIVNVDYTPRLNSTYYRFFRTAEGRALEPQEFLDLFFHHDIRSGRSKKTPPSKAAAPATPPRPTVAPSPSSLALPTKKEIAHQLDEARNGLDPARTNAIRWLFQAFARAEVRDIVLRELIDSKRLAHFIEEHASSLDPVFLRQYEAALAKLETPEEAHKRAAAVCNAALSKGVLM